ncbi:MAG: hypothetical protein AAFU79_36510, partial [Myxococcota bacterium]
ENEAAGPYYNLRDVDSSLADLLGVSPRDIRVRDVAVHPTSKEAYIAVGVAAGDSYESTIAIINQSGDARLMDTDLPTETLDVPSAPAEEFFFYRDIFASRDLSFTDLEFHDGQLFVAGMSNADFASSMWVAPYPFEGAASTTTLEIYHGVHAQYETRAPIRAMEIIDIDGEDYMLAAYTCTPLVLFPLEGFEDGEHIVGKTIGELGYGNTPGDILAFDTEDGEGNPFPVIFIQNKSQSAQVMAKDAVVAAAAGEGITTPLGLEPVVLGAANAPMVGVLQAADQDPGRILTLRRDPDQGDLELVSFLKGVYFRLSDFQSEYEIPGYEYPPEQDSIREFQNFMKLEEGYPELIVD